ncbi:ABC transporter permease [Paenibacillus humicola]|uniref:ABC transporter permease n=1 Tax=Paenibacillus humicola TaxID=3110540 RepID=UPI00237A8B31|nr:ABC transporter permease [Paenibacillus humicola]
MELTAKERSLEEVQDVMPEQAEEMDEGSRSNRSFLRKLYSGPIAWVSSGWIFLVVAAAVFAPLLTPYSPVAGDIADKLMPIGTAGHFLGTDDQGRDLAARIFFGGRITLLMGIVPVAVAGLIGCGLGIAAGYFGKTTGTVIMRCLDVFYAFPALVLAIAISAALGPGISNALVSLPIVFIAPIARITETAVKQVKGLEFFEAARASGAGHWMIIRHHLLSNIFRPVFAYVTTLIGISILIASSLSFLGLGVSPPTAEWGAMLGSLQNALFIVPSVAIPPGIVIFLTALSFNLLSDCIQDALDVRS